MKAFLTGLGIGKGHLEHVPLGRELAHVGVSLEHD
jgi:hypothetical protein